MKRATNIIVKARTTKGAETTDHYSMMDLQRLITQHLQLNEKIVLAYSGGLDTSVILRWLRENYKAEIIVYTSDIGQALDKKNY